MSLSKWLIAYQYIFWKCKSTKELNLPDANDIEAKFPCNFEEMWSMFRMTSILHSQLTLRFSVVWRQNTQHTSGKETFIREIMKIYSYRALLHLSKMAKLVNSDQCMTLFLYPCSHYSFNSPITLNLPTHLIWVPSNTIFPDSNNMLIAVIEII